MYCISGIAFLLAVVLADSHQPIPPHLLQRLKSAQSLNELLSVTTLFYSPRTNGRASSRYRKIGYGTSNEQHQIKIQGASIIAFSASRHIDSGSEVEIDGSMQRSLEILSSIRQGNDTCTLQSICVPVPVENPDPGILVFPRCYEVTQCVGSCCDSAESCHATAVEYLQKPIVEMVYAGHNRFVINQTLNITMEQHRGCSCRECALEGPEPECAPGKVIGASCTCECANQISKNNCKGGSKNWDEDTCTCQCPITSCPSGSALNEIRCVCEEPLIDLNEPDDGGNFRSDISKIPRLRSHMQP